MNAALNRQWERLWAPYDQQTYQTVLNAICADDVILDIGAGDLRLARQMARRARLVYAIEDNAALLPQCRFPCHNLQVIGADARTTPFPSGVTKAVLLMRHCTQYGLYVEKLRRIGCRWLLTNARWGMGVEYIDLGLERISYAAVSYGWYGCECGGTGFQPGPPEALTTTILTTVTEVADCPHCEGHGRQAATREAC